MLRIVYEVVGSQWRRDGVREDHAALVQVENSGGRARVVAIKLARSDQILGMLLTDCEVWERRDTEGLNWTSGTMELPSTERGKTGTRGKTNLKLEMSIQGYGFSSSHIQMWELDHKEGWALKNWCFQTVELEKTLESPLDCKEIQPVHPKADQSWCSLEGLMLKLKLQYFGHLMRRAESLEKTLMLGKFEGRRRRDNRAWDGWMASLTQWHGFGWTPGVGDGQGGLECCGSWGHKESDMTEWLSWTESTHC